MSDYKTRLDAAYAQRDWDTVETVLDELFTKNCDVYGAATQALFGYGSIATFKQRRELVKRVFMRVFRVSAPRLILAQFEYVGRIVKELQKRGLFRDIDKTISVEMHAEEAALDAFVATQKAET